MKIGKHLAIAAAASMLAAPTMAQASTAPDARTAAPVADSESFAGGADMFLFLAIFVGTVVLAIIAMDDAQNSEPTSP